MSQSGFDDREHAAEKSAAAREREQDAPGLEIGGPAAVAQAAELMETPTAGKDTPAAAQAAPVMRRPAIAPTQVDADARLAQPLVEVAQPVVALSPDGGGGGAEQRDRGAAQIHAPGPRAAIDAAMQLRAAGALQQHALLDEPPARTPVALRRKKRRPAPAPAVKAADPDTA